MFPDGGAVERIEVTATSNLVAVVADAAEAAGIGHIDKVRRLEGATYEVTGWPCLGSHSCPICARLHVTFAED